MNDRLHIKKKLRPTGSLLRANTLLGKVFVENSVSHSPYDETTLDLLLRIYLADSQSIRANEICEQVMLSPSHVSRCLDSVETHGLIKRTEDPNDKRASLITLTTRGKKSIEEYLPHLMDDLDSTVYKEFTADEIATLTKLLNRLAAVAAEYSQKG